MEKKKAIQAIIVDDEKGCITNLQHYLTKLCPDITIAATGSTLDEALHNASDTHIDLAFLDIELVDDNIFNSLSTHSNANFKIVFVTAHQQYAIKAIKVEALDYILKPLLEDDILECYSKIKKHFSQVKEETGTATQNENEKKKNKKIILRSSDKVYIIKADDIYYMTGSGFYSEITFLVGNEVKSIVISKPLNKIEEEYEGDFFFRVHKSYIINITKISSVIKNDGMSLKMLNEQLIPVAKRRTNDFMEFLNAG